MLCIWVGRRYGRISSVTDCHFLHRDAGTQEGTVICMLMSLKAKRALIFSTLFCVKLF